MNDMNETQPIGGATPAAPDPSDVPPSAATDEQAGALAPPSAPPPPPTAPLVDGPVGGPVEGAGGAPTGLRDRVLGLRAVAAVALASLVLGGLGGTALGALSDGEDTDQQRGPGGGQFAPGQRGQLQDDQVPGQVPNGSFRGRGPGGQQGQLPPGTAPDSDVVPDTGAGGTQSGSTT